MARLGLFSYHHYTPRPGFEPVPFVALPPSSLALNSNFGEALISAQVLTVFFVVKVIRQIKYHLAVH